MAWCVCLPELTPTNKAGIFLFAMIIGIAAASLVPPWIYGAPLGIDVNEAMKNASTVNGIYEATATILGLVGLGSIIGVKFSTNKEQFGVQRGGLVLVGGCNVLVILIQTLIMLGVCCAGLPIIVYGMYVWLTGVSLMGMVFGYVVMAFAQMGETGYRQAREYNIDDATR